MRELATEASTEKLRNSCLRLALDYDELAATLEVGECEPNE